MDTGRWFDSAKPNTIAHESGHLMGLPDRYTEQKGSNGERVTPAKPGCEKSIMGKFGQPPALMDIQDIINSGGKR